MAAALGAALERRDAAVVVGIDAPTLPIAHLAAAIDALRSNDVTLAPSADGGYHAIGARGPITLEGIRWSCRHTLADTLRALGERTVRLLPLWYDVDEPADLRLLAAHLALAPRAAPRTLEALVDLGVAF